MKKYLIGLPFFGILFLCVKCNNTDIMGFGKQSPKVTPRNIVLCDFTSSIDSAHSIEKIKSDALKIFSAVGKDEKIEYYIISKNENSSRLFRSILLADDPRPSEETAFWHQKDSLKYLLDSTYLESRLHNRKEPNSSIIAYIGRAIKYFKTYDGYDSIPLRLFILSDMLECSKSRNGNLCIESPANIKNQIPIIHTMIDTTNSLREFKHISIYPVLSTAKNPSNYGSDFDDFWNIVFRTYGCRQLPVCTVNLPDYIENNNEANEK